MIHLTWSLYGLGYLSIALFILYLAKKMFDFLTPFTIDTQLSEKDNPAVGLVLVGFLAGVVGIICSVLHVEPSGPLSLQAFLADLAPMFSYAAGGMVLLFLAGIINDKLVLRQFSNFHEIAGKHNTAVGSVMGAAYLGSGLIVAGSIGSSYDPMPIFIGFLLGQLAFVLFALIYERITSYNFQESIGEQKNLAAGIGFGGTLVGYGIILMHGSAESMGQSLPWLERIGIFGYYAVVGAVLLLLVQIITDRIFLPHVNLSHAIAQDRNLNAGILEAGLSVSMGAVLIFSL